ncbi:MULTISPECIES: transposase [unclassified Sphingobium]|uniref:transposase n=1 Tax=unclassified Sphingobium TaxID=2611147 RepID=UPI0022251E8D|nr:MULTISPECIES: transposase [unclassified Sphingobium]MCW2410382.1 transposase [Sphingobium sp. B8D3D]MCW2413925.1 transposase [Sphingobium sp. B8D3A]
MVSTLPMRFRGLHAGEALSGFVSDCATTYFAHPGSLLELAGCPLSLERTAFISRDESDRLAHLLSRDPVQIAERTYPTVRSAQRDIPFIDFHGAVLRRSHLLAGRRRLSPAAMRASNHVRAHSLIQPIIFCPETWTLLTDRCLACGKHLTWVDLEHVSHCHRCGADQRDHETEEVPADLRDALGRWADLVHPLADRRQAIMSRLPEKLCGLVLGEVFELVLGIADTAGSQLGAIASAMNMIMDWPNGIIAALDADVADSGSRHSLSSRLRRHAQLPNTLRAARSLLIYDLARDRGRQLGTKAELASAARKAGGMTVREAAKQIGLAPIDVVTLRRAGVIESKSVTHGRAHRTLLTYPSVDIARKSLSDRMPVQEFVQATGFSHHAVDQLIQGGHLQHRRNAAIDALYDRPVLARSIAETFIEQVRAVTTPLGYDDDDWIPLSKAFAAVGGRPKPYPAFFTWVFQMRSGLRAPMNTHGTVDISQLHVSPMILHHLDRYRSRFDGADRCVSYVTAQEILNCSAAAVQTLIARSALDLQEGGIVLSSVQAVSRQLISLDEINARLGFQERRAVTWLHQQKLQQVFPGFASRKEVRACLGAQIPLGLWRRSAMRLTLKQVKRGRGDLSAREWDLVRGWIPRQRRSSHGICDRTVTNAAIWISATGRCWKDLPKRYGCAEASYARYRQLKRCGALEQVTRILERELQRNQSCELSPVLV